MSAISEVLNGWEQLSRLGASNVLPRGRQLIEMALLRLCRGIGPGYFMQARWWRADVPFAHKWRHFNRTEYNAFIDRLNAPNYRKISQHKLAEKALLQTLGLPTPRFIGFVHAVRGRTSDGEPLCNAEHLTRLFRRHVGQRICCKQVEGWGGSGFVAYDVILRDEVVSMCNPVTRETLTPSDWWRASAQATAGVLLESYLAQHPALAALNPNSVNTIRIWVYEKDGEFHVPGAYLRVGRAGNQVDNISIGGLCCPVDTGTGRTVASMDCKNGCHPCPKHPDTSARLLDFEIPYWSECKVMAGIALSAFPHMQLAGLDIAVTETGPCIIELNVQPDYIGCAWMDLALGDLPIAKKA